MKIKTLAPVEIKYADEDPNCCDDHCIHHLDDLLYPPHCRLFDKNLKEKEGKYNVNIRCFECKELVAMTIKQRKDFIKYINNKYFYPRCKPCLKATKETKIKAATHD